MAVQLINSDGGIDKQRIIAIKQDNYFKNMFWVILMSLPKYSIEYFITHMLIYRNKLFFRTDNFAVNIQPSRGLVVVPWVRTMLVMMTFNSLAWTSARRWSKAEKDLI